MFLYPTVISKPTQLASYPLPQCQAAWVGVAPGQALKNLLVRPRFSSQPRIEHFPVLVLGCFFMQYNKSPAQKVLELCSKALIASD
jgi:hypothetical protein